jgi:protease-4
MNNDIFSLRAENRKLTAQLLRSLPMRKILQICILIASIGGPVCLGKTPATTQSTTTAATKAASKIVVMRLDGEIIEAPPSVDLGMSELQLNQFWDQLRLIRMVKNDPEVSGLVILIDEPKLSLAQCQQLAMELKKLRESGKKVYVHADSISTSLYLLALPAERIGMSPGAMLMVNGIAAQVFYYKNLMDKLGIDADVEHLGNYKLAAEPFTATQPSQFMDEQMNSLLVSLYSQTLQAIGDARKMTVPEVEAVVDRGPFVAEQALQEKLIDQVIHRQEMLKEIRQSLGGRLVYNYGQGEMPEVQSGFSGLMQIFNMIGSKGSKDGQDKVAIVYVTGMVVEGETQEFFDSAQTAGAQTMRKAFAEIRKNDRIKAVVVRIDSPGGSATASEIIWNLVRSVPEGKPVIVSMGAMAGSGGYYIASAGSYIYASPGTLTGSIGVITGKPVLKNMIDKIYINYKTYARGKNATLFDPMSHLNDDQRKMLHDQMVQVFDQFKDRVMVGRRDKIRNIDELATGRVYTGEQGLGLGLVDGMGSLADAVELAASKAKITSYDVIHLPKPKTLVEVLLEGMGYRVDPEQMFAASRIMSGMSPEQKMLMLVLPGINTSVVNETLMLAKLLQGGNVLMVAPYHIEVR